MHRQVYMDGGIVDNAPLKVAIEKGDTEIVCIANSPKKVFGADVNTGSVIQVADRIVEVMLNKLNIDIAKVAEKKLFLSAGLLTISARLR